MDAYAVKHFFKDYGSVTKVIEEIKNKLNGHPYSYTSRSNQAKNAIGNTIYVIEVSEERGKRDYWLGYSYVSTIYEGNPKYKKSSKVFEEMFKFKNSSPFVYSKPVSGFYFDEPILIPGSSKIDKWLREKPRGMAKIPDNECVNELEAIISNPKNNAQQF